MLTAHWLFNFYKLTKTLQISRFQNYIAIPVAEMQCFEDRPTKTSNSAILYTFHKSVGPENQNFQLCQPPQHLLW